MLPESANHEESQACPGPESAKACAEEREEGRVEYIPLKVPAGVLLSVGAGIYNSVAGAIKELVNNSFDADARGVTISTDFPRFERMKILDNGHGMTAHRFKQAISMIGNSLKRTIDTNQVTAKYKRPIIGRLGIGLMALAQICDKAIIESNVRGEPSKFVAELYFSHKLEDTWKQQEAAKLDVFREQYGGLEQMERIIQDANTDDFLRREVKDVYELARQADHILKQKGLEDPEGEHLGYCFIYHNLPALAREYGTIVTLEQIRPSVRRLLQDKDRAKDALPERIRNNGASWDDYRYKVKKWKWPTIVERLGTARFSYQSLPRYHQFLWELSIMSPLPYLPNAPVTIEPDVLAQKKEELNQFQFSVRVDHQRLFKPVLLPSDLLARHEEPLWRSIPLGNNERDYLIENFSRHGHVGGKPLSYYGYIYWQRKQVQPTPLRGIQIYIRHAGIGLYDQTLMNFLTLNPTSIADHISGEIYVEEGLEQALNIDRNRFRETDEHYCALQKHVWQILGSATKGDGIIGKSINALRKREEQTTLRELSEHRQELADIVKGINGNHFLVSFSDDDKEEPIEVVDDRIIVHDNSPYWSNSINNRILLQKLLVPMSAVVAGDSSREDLFNLLERLLLNHTQRVP